ncbi:MAG: sel1 repeat family protein, partial [Lachnospiraceae bacterium]|nr:sel1 repeat family protein [Lachnospiraceae bacterium]
SMMKFFSKGKMERIDNSQRCTNGRKQAEQEVKTEEMPREEIVRLIASGKEAISSQEFQQAASFFHQAAEQGDSEAQYQLGLLYLEGLGVKKDEKTGAGWIQKSAAQEHNEAIRKLAWCYLNGRGVRQSLAESVKLSQKASGAGSQIDMNKYGLLVRK